MKKTNAVRIVENNNIECEILEYDTKDGKKDAISVANKLGVEECKVFKTLVTVGNDKEYYVFCIPGSETLSLKKAACAAKVKKIELIKLSQLYPLTGYYHGGCSPIGMKKTFATFIDETAQMFDEIIFSAGVVGLQFKIKLGELQKVMDFTFSDLI